MNAKNLDLVDTAFLQLSFSIKLWHFLDVHPIDKDLFDVDLTVEDGGARISLPHGEFESYDAMKVASEHNVPSRARYATAGPSKLSMKG